MDDQQTPTLMDIAQIVNSPISRESYPDSVPALMWLIKQSPKAQALLDELNKDSGDRPTIMELAKLLCSIESWAEFPECLHTVRWLIGQSEAAQALYAEVERMTKDAGGSSTGARA